MTRRQTEGKETWRRLLDWDRGQAPSERLAAQILRNEGYEAIDPSHPLGGQDGLRDIICTKNQVEFIGASYFPRGQQSFGEIKKKFVDDLEGVAKNNAEGIAFVTNQELTLSKREELIKAADIVKVDLFHLERIASILDSPQCYGIRLEFLDIEMTKEEQLAFMATVSQLSNRIDEIFKFINRSDIIREEVDKILATQNKPKAPDYVTPIPVLTNPLFSSGIIGEQLKKCSHCGYGYVVKGGYTRAIAALYGQSGRSVASCPKCGNAEYIP